MKLKILNKTNFIQKFLSPISRVNDLCTLTLDSNSISNINRTSDNNFGLYCVSNEIEVEDFTGKKNLSFADIKKFNKVFDCIKENEITLNINENNVEYKSNGTKFKFHLISDNIVKTPNFNLEKINALEFDIQFVLPMSTLQLLLKSSTFITDSNKIYLSTDGVSVFGELTDKTRDNIDSYSTVLSESYIGEPINKPIPFNFDLFRNISSLKTNEIRVSLNSIKGVMVFDIQDESYKLKYISTAHVS